MELFQLNTPDFLVGFAQTRIGGRAENQDSMGWSETPFGYLVTVCDGMGGGPGGKTASEIAVREIITCVREANRENTLENILIKAVRQANIKIIEAGNANPALKGMGSTCTVLLINEDCAYVAHVGDSRIYQLRGKSKVFRTFDHSMVFGLVKQKVITEEQARLSQQSNIITRALGINYDVEVDVEKLSYQAKDRFLLCTDGIHGSVPENDLIDMVADRDTALGTVVDTIATNIDGIGRASGGGHDNLTLALIETNINSIYKKKMEKKTKNILIALCALLGISATTNVAQLFVGGGNKGVETTCPMDSTARQIPKDSISFDSLMNISDSLKASIDALNTKVDSTKNENKKLEEKNKELKENNKNLKEENKELRKEIDNLKKEKK